MDATERYIVGYVCVQVRGYVEVHLEQGPVLEVTGKPLGVVSSIAGQTRLSVSIIGTQVLLCPTTDYTTAYNPHLETLSWCLPCQHTDGVAYCLKLQHSVL